MDSASANQEEARRAKEQGRKALQDGDYARAIRLLRISDRLSPDADTRQYLASAQAATSRERGQSGTQDQRGARVLAVGGLLATLNAGLDVVAEWFPQYATRLLARYVHRDFRRPLAWVALVIAVLIVYRLLLRGPRLPLGSLPGDIRVTGASYVIYSPVVSCLLLSGFARLVQRVFAQHVHQA